VHVVLKEAFELSNATRTAQPDPDKLKALCKAMAILESRKTAYATALIRVLSERGNHLDRYVERYIAPLQAADRPHARSDECGQCALSGVDIFWLSTSGHPDAVALTILETLYGRSLTGWYFSVADDSVVNHCRVSA
jgi:hypothetical protein